MTRRRKKQETAVETALAGRAAPLFNRRTLLISAAIHIVVAVWLQWSASPTTYAFAALDDPADVLLLLPPPPEEAPPVPLADQLSALLESLPDEVLDAQEVQLEELTPSEIGQMKAQMAKCWSVPVGAAGAHKLIIAVRIALSPEGRLLTRPEILNDPGSSNPFFRTAAESALRAIRRCQPFQMPEEKYESWKNIVLVFNPEEMVDG